jgi:hypothetical protein
MIYFLPLSDTFIALNIWYATCGTIAFPSDFMVSLRHFEKEISANSWEIPSFRLQTLVLRKVQAGD